ncbi:MAG: ribose-5-phosphate isomerase RpiA [Anaerolineales bacterium]|jgi:ribose 5-phosphate isomerase A
MNLKQEAARRALDFVQDGMCLGLGSGSTTTIFVDMLGERWQKGELQHIRGVPTSQATEERARRWGIPLASLTDLGQLDLVVDGADEVDPQLNLIKGLGKALLREKIIEIHARRFLVIVDESKLTQRLGGHVPLPVEIVRFEAQSHIRWLNGLGCRAEQWFEDGNPVITDNGNFLALCHFEEMGGIPDVAELAQELALRPGIVEHGLFLGMAQQVIVAGQKGVRLLERPS